MSIEQEAVNSIRTLSIDMVEKANSGHPGMPMGAAPMAYELWMNHMKHNPSNPNFFDRDRFVLSAGHGSALLYSLLHLTGYDLSLDDLKNFRQWGSKTPGHPEFGHTPGVEATTGPLGQGIATAVGMAMAEAHLAATYNKDKFDLVNHYTYAICGDGDLMEGISAEAISMAGHMGLGKLIVLYDSNDISLDGELHMSFSENVGQRLQACGWHYLKVDDGTNLLDISQAIQKAKAAENRPTLIEVRTVIGYGSPNKSGKSASHGSPLGKEEASLTKESYQWKHESFEIPEDIYQHFNQVKEKGQKEESEWYQKLNEYKKRYPELAEQFELAIRNELPGGWDKDLPVYKIDSPKMATRQSSGLAINAIAKNLPTVFGGSADLAGSNNTTLKGLSIFSKDHYQGRNIWFGVREHAMGAALNGLALHGGVRPYAGTFFVFSDYLRPSIRLAALMKQPVVYVFTHDSIAVGEDGPTHEPVEQLPSLRAIPGLTVIRPADANETTEAYRYAFEQRNEPVAMVLTRQALPVLEGTVELAREGVRKGAYVVSDSEEEADVILLASGSEVSLAVEAKKELVQKGIAVRIVSMPSWELFEQQSDEYKESVLPTAIKARVAIEMAYPLGWERYIGDEGKLIAVTDFGASGTGEKVVSEYGFTTENVIATVEKLAIKVK
ncbi:transketolase [Halalkalibacter akibai]|uniref:Transketolase n=1 Tax=Halalkalibacter akibai (strain ATCC 43226 / DSM 21942 / CIP 109018 / JCM 9157 / 1139) TaxID=1236973 RepID=W4QRM9_HALA3|nr:transketolase [Halalkalibacter akibai]GAE33964.1 transketolase [Halalkalibacter akibai JCM 9157]